MSPLCALNWIGTHIPSVASLMLAFQSLHQANLSSCLLSRVTHREPTLLPLGNSDSVFDWGDSQDFTVVGFLLVHVLTWSQHQDKCTEDPWCYTVISWWLVIVPFYWIKKEQDLWLGKWLSWKECSANVSMKVQILRTHIKGQPWLHKLQLQLWRQRQEDPESSLASCPRLNSELPVQ